MVGIETNRNNNNMNNDVHFFRSTKIKYLKRIFKNFE